VSLLLGLTLTSAGCVSFTAPRYAMTPETVATLRMFQGQTVGVGPFTAAKPGQTEIICRGAGPVRTPDGEPFEQFIRRALISELTFAGMYAPGSAVTLTGRLDDIDFSSGLTDAAWKIAMTLSAGGRAITAREDYRFSSAFVGDTACQNTAQALMPAVQGLIAKLVQHDDFPTLIGYAGRPPAAATQVGGGAARPSTITITLSYPTEKARLTEERVTVVGLVSAPGGVQRVDLVVNGRPMPVSRDVRVQSAEMQNHPFTADVPLRPGENVIAITAVDGSGGATQAVRTIYREGGAATTTAPVTTGQRWAVVIGIDQYKDPTIGSLRYATADAEAVFRFLTTRGGVKPGNARLLLNNAATQRNIREALGTFLRQRALREDEVIIYYAGHGTTEPDQSAEGGVAKYLVPWDADPQDLFASAIPMEEIDKVFGRLSARKILLVQDTCFSGGAGGRTFLAKGLTVRSTALTDRFLQDLSQKEGRMILTASDVNQVSQEDPALGHGIFTHYLLEAIGGAADLDGDGAITVREVHLYLQRKVHERSAGVQTPQLYNIGDMVLVRK
jgi:hypothetical protein